MSIPNAIEHLSPPNGLKGILCDIDDTLTHNGRLVPKAFEMLARAHAAGLKIIPITGRPGGWVDQIARMWPVDGVVGENGGLWFWYDGDKLHRRFSQSNETRVKNRIALTELGKKIIHEVKGCALASDQPYRDLDLAIDFCEDVPPLGQESIEQIVSLFDAAGATSKVSSIHVNGWYGDFDKLSGFESLIKDRWGGEFNQREWAFFGDSANDEPMFKAFDYSIGVANVARFLPYLTDPPKWITSKDGGHGFVEGMKVLFPNI